eukprot:CAMPEP_0175000894 /NCGR_PEP_ID=MMETSP0005-20121125/2839_1 /TAXON_ID=420556 /ORGANISM="Ochromonas sp., Strain CCMP1393" /LENGTH=1630 /DNA_ID=CAMNT_0016255735 /DNA_START=161 /DNA_END=5053 /DNA_ORIENTATION=-
MSNSITDPGFCTSLSHFYPVHDYIPGLRTNIGIILLISGALNIFMSLITVLWIKSQRQRAQEENGGEDAVKSVIFPVFVKILWLSVAVNTVSGMLIIFVPVHRAGHNSIGAAAVFGFLWAMQHAVLEGVAFLLMQKGCGQHAAIRSATWASIWAVFVFLLMFCSFYFHGTFVTVLSAVRDAILVSFYLILWLAPDAWVFRRPAALFYSKCWALYRSSFLCTYIILIGTGTEYLVNCGYIILSLIIFAIIQPLIMYSTLLRDSDWWQGIDITPRRTAAAAAALAMKRRFDAYSAADGGGGGDDYDIRYPLMGSEYSLVSAQTLAGTLDDMRLRGNVTMLNFACIKMDTRKHLGAGSFSKVYKGTYRGRDCAIKLIYTMDLTVDTIKRVAAEASILSSIRHPNIVNILGVSVLPPSVCLILELCSFGSLSDIIRGYGFDWRASHRAPLRLSFSDVIHLSLGCARGLAAVHAYDPTLCHRDVKSFNFLVDQQFRVKIADLELGVLSTATAAAGKEGKQRQTTTVHTSTTTTTSTPIGEGDKADEGSLVHTTAGGSSSSQDQDQDDLEHGRRTTANTCGNGEDECFLKPSRHEQQLRKEEEEEEEEEEDPHKVDVNDLLANWLAPEVILEGRFQQASDVHALGTVLWEIISGLLPFDNEYPVMIRRKIANGYTHPIPNQYQGTVIGQLISKCWSFEPHRRPSSAEIATSLEEVLKEQCYGQIKNAEDIPDTTALRAYYDQYYRKSVYGDAALHNRLFRDQRGGILHHSKATSVTSRLGQYLTSPFRWHHKNENHHDLKYRSIPGFDYDYTTENGFGTGENSLSNSQHDMTALAPTQRQLFPDFGGYDVNKTHNSNNDNHGCSIWDGDNFNDANTLRNSSLSDQDRDSFRNSSFQRSSMNSDGCAGLVGLDNFSAHSTTAVGAAVGMNTAAARDREVEGGGGGGHRHSELQRDSDALLRASLMSVRTSYILSDLQKRKRMYSHLPRAALDVIGVVKEEPFWDALEKNGTAWAVTTIEAPFIVMHATSHWYKLFNIRHSMGSYQHMYSLMSLIGREDADISEQQGGHNRANKHQNFTSSNAYVNEWKDVNNSGNAGNTGNTLHNNATNALLMEMHEGCITNKYKDVHGVLCFNLPSNSSNGNKDKSNRPNSGRENNDGISGKNESNNNNNNNNNNSNNKGSSSSLQDLLSSATGRRSSSILGRSATAAAVESPKGHNLMCTVHIYPIYADKTREGNKRVSKEKQTMAAGNDAEAVGTAVAKRGGGGDEETKEGALSVQQTAGKDERANIEAMNASYISSPGTSPPLPVPATATATIVTNSPESLQRAHHSFLKRSFTTGTLCSPPALPVVGGTAAAVAAVSPPAGIAAEANSTGTGVSMENTNNSTATPSSPFPLLRRTLTQLSRGTGSTPLTSSFSFSAPNVAAAPKPIYYAIQFHELCEQQQAGDSANATVQSTAAVVTSSAAAAAAAGGGDHGTSTSQQPPLQPQQQQQMPSTLSSGEVYMRTPIGSMDGGSASSTGLNNMGVGGVYTSPPPPATTDLSSLLLSPLISPSSSSSSSSSSPSSMLSCEDYISSVDEGEDPNVTTRNSFPVSLSSGFRCSLVGRFWTSSGTSTADDQNQPYDYNRRNARRSRASK